jgi:hypothetical protein
MVRADYRTIIYKFVGGWSNEVPLWRDSSQKLTLDKKVYPKGDVIKGRIEFECLEEPTNPKYIEGWGRHLTTIKVYGVFKAIVE